MLPSPGAQNAVRPSQCRCLGCYPYKASSRLPLAVWKVCLKTPHNPPSLVSDNSCWKDRCCRAEHTRPQESILRSGLAGLVAASMAHANLPQVYYCSLALLWGRRWGRIQRRRKRFPRNRSIFRQPRFRPAISLFGFHATIPKGSRSLGQVASI